MDINKSPQFSSVIFDLDGTIIDSAESIFLSLQRASHKLSLNIKIPFDRSIIGPQLDKVVKKLTKIDNPIIINSLMQIYKEIYDEEGYKNAYLYEGIEKLLVNLKNSEIKIILATNKRIIPTLKILKYFQLQHYFETVYAIDMIDNEHFPSKSKMLSSLILEKKLDPHKTLYVGDRMEDQIAAEENLLLSVTVGWGYDNYKFPKQFSKLILTTELLSNYILGKA